MEKYGQNQMLYFIMILLKFFSRTLDKKCIDKSIYNNSERDTLKFKTATKSV